MKELTISVSYTSRDSRAVADFIRDANQYPLLSVEEEVELSYRAQHGDAAARDRLVNSNLRFVISVAKQYEGRGLPLEDLINEGCIGLVKAVERFDATMGFKLISYAVWWIRESIEQAISTTSDMVRMPQNKLQALRTIRRTAESIRQREYRDPDAQEIADNLPEGFDLTAAQVERIMAVGQRTVQADAPLTDEEDSSSIIDLYTDGTDTDAELLEDEQKRYVERLLTQLTPRQSQVMREYYGIGCQEKSHEEIGMEMGVSSERVRQIRLKGLETLRRACPAH